MVVRDDGQFVLENTTRFTSNDSNFVETFWTSSNFDFEYSRYNWEAQMVRRVDGG